MSNKRSTAYEVDGRRDELIEWECDCGCTVKMWHGYHAPSKEFYEKYQKGRPSMELNSTDGYCSRCETDYKSGKMYSDMIWRLEND
jgi:hypothetical protein